MTNCAIVANPYPRPVLYMTRGLPASGKSTWAKRMVLDTDSLAKRVNKDDLRAMLDVGVWSEKNEKFVVQVRDAIILRALEAGLDIYVDDCNLHPAHEINLRRFARAAMADFKIVGFEVSVDECIRRDKERPTGLHVGASVIMGMAENWRKSWNHRCSGADILFSDEFPKVKENA